MSTLSIVYLIAYLVVAALSLALPALESRFPRVAGVVQMLSALGLDMPRLLDGLRKLAAGQATGIIATNARKAPNRDGLP